MLKRLLFSVITVGLMACGSQPQTSKSLEAWNKLNDPLKLNGEYERKLDFLPLEASLEKTPWTDSYWPSTNGGLANRWKNYSANPFKAKLHNKKDLLKLDEKEVAKLSPAEKYDILIGDYSYPLTKHERSRTSPNAEGWEGLCHGWAAAAINFEEPKSIIIENADGIKIPFGSSDIKGLLTFLQGNYSNAPTKFLGSRCNIDLNKDPNAATRPECRDTNAGAFHIVLTNQIGLRNEAFVADVTRDLQVWNQPIHSFTSTIVSYQEPSHGAAPGTIREAVIETRMTYTVEVHANWDTLLGTEEHANNTKRYEYRVELNANDEIIGGEWISDVRPDFLWMQSKPEFSGFFSQLKDVYDLSLSSDAAYPDPTIGN